jgi:hypothetical protein
MNRAAGWVAAGIACLAASANAQTAPGGVPDVPAGEGTLRGRIEHATRPEAAAGLPVVLYALPAAGSPGLRETRADAEGAFVFANVSNDPSTLYLVGVRAGEVPFGARAQFAPGEREHRLVLAISDPTAEAAGVRVESALLELSSGCRSLLVRESHRLHNPTSKVVFVPEPERAGREALFRSTLPEAATDFEGHAGMFGGGLALEGRELAFWGPLYPGTQTLDFAWSLPADGGRAELVRVLDSGAGRLSVRSPAGAPPPRGSGLGRGRTVHEQARAWREQSAGALAPGGRIELAIELSVAEASAALGMGEARYWLELDDAALEVDAQIQLEVAQATPLVSATGAPLLCLPLPPGAEGLRFGSETLALGLAPGGAGEIAVQGPLPPGPSHLVLRYHLPVRDGAAALPLRFPLRLPQLSVFVTDTGVRADATRLHRRRPFRSEDRSYMHLEAFQIEAGEPVDLSLARLAPHRPLPAAARGGFAVLLAALAAGFLIAPLRTASPEPAPVSPRAALAAAERESVLAALRDLEEDFATGKLDAADHAQMHAELRARAVALLAAERDALTAPPPPAAPAPPRCPSCAAETGPGARFCASCGVRLAAASGDGAGSAA